ncbi:TPA: hypothetical protein HA265_04490 [Candidatus Woesearchaeota archaeon]|nr:hypothetical protein [Candidatus Woesearchaeota archaeon]
MVDFSKLQKISNLARELMKHGQANSMDEAMRLASQQVESGNIPEYVDAPAPPPSSAGPKMAVEHIDVPDLKMPEVKEGADQGDMVRQLQEIVNRQQSTIAKLSTIINVHTNQLTELGQAGDKFNRLVAEISEIKSDLKKLKESPVMPSPGSKGQTSFKPSSPQMPQPPEGGRVEEIKKSAPTSSGHARSGNYQSEDVSIEKFFYYGGR